MSLPSNLLEGERECERDGWRPCSWLVLTGGWGLREYNARLATEHLLEASFQRSFHSLITHMENLDLALSKSLVSGSQRQNIIMLTNIWHEANEAQEALAGLPFRELDLTNVQRYLAQVGITPIP